eukprot:1148305-Pelagomonas_calceolata.AAC.1
MNTGQATNRAYSCAVPGGVNKNNFRVGGRPPKRFELTNREPPEVGWCARLGAAAQAGCECVSGEAYTAPQKGGLLALSYKVEEMCLSSW